MEKLELLRKALPLFLAILLMSGCQPDDNKPASGDQKIILTVWHDKGDDGISYIKELNKIFKSTHPNVEVVSTSFPTNQWQQKTLASISTNNPPDLVFNDASRIIEIQQNTKGFIDLNKTIEASDGQKFITNEDRFFLKADEKLVVYPVNRTLAGLGIRKSWLENVGEGFPETWDDFVRVGEKFTTGDPDRNGQNDTSGFIMHLGVDPGQMFSLFINGSGNNDVWLKEGPTPTVADNHLERFTQISSLYTKHKVMPKDAVTQDFADMYKVIESGTVGMFRVGNWNVKKWDETPVLKDDYIVGPFPKMNPKDSNNFVQLNVRGFAATNKSPHQKESKEFLKFLLSEEAQKLSFKYFSSSIRSDLELETSNTLTPFYSTDNNIVATDTHFSRYDYYRNMNEKYEQMLAELVNSKPENVKEIIQQGSQNIKKVIEIRKN
ncbi:ABC transporter substrate-binding protein [Metabacillus sp. SLBN-84]